MSRIPKQATETISNNNYWKSHSTRGKPMPTLTSPCHDCAITTGFYQPYADKLKEQPIEMQREVVKRWFCHNHGNRACKGLADQFKFSDKE
jgi:hypothetical protein